MMRISWRHALLLLVLFGSLGGLWMGPAIPQNLHYHDFADQRGWLGIPNFADVMSNVPYLFVGIAGLRLRGRLTTSWGIFFFGVALVSVGSGYYHWAPANATLVWDRMPMTIAFMALFTALVSEFVDPRLEKGMLAPALGIGAASVIYWDFTDDLRWYAWVQFGPLLVLPIMMRLFRSRYTHTGMIWIALGGYGLAKVFEALDWQIFAWTHGAVAGHAMKHLVSAGSCWVILEMVRRRSAKA
jgi:hypothetical protein